MPTFSTAADQMGMPPVPWFLGQPFPSDIPQPLCICPYPNPNDLPRMMPEADSVTAAGGHSLGQYTDAYNWMTQQRLYDRLSQFPGLFGSVGTGISNFFQYAQSDAIGEFNTVSKGINDLVKRDEVSRFQIGRSIEQMGNLYAALQVLRQNPATNKIQRRVKAQQLLQEMLRYRTYLSSVEQDQESEINMVLSANQTLAEDLIFETNEKTINRIILENHLWRTKHILSADQITLHQIAGQCPLSGGFSVYVARSILNTLGESLSWNDDLLCMPVSTERSKGHTTHLNSYSLPSLFPNPANQYLLIDGIPVSHSGKVLKLYSITGEELISISLNGDQNAVEVNTSRLNDGLYLLKIVSENSTILVGKAAIVH